MIRYFRVSLLFVLALGVLAWLPQTGRAQTQGLDFAPNVTRFDFTSAGVSSMVVGWQFTTSANVSVYNLGFYDSGLAPLNDPGNGTKTLPNGFTASHAVGLYDAIRGTLLVQAVVPQDSLLLDSNFRYAGQLLDNAGTPITGPYTLTASGTYILLGVSNGENFTYVQNAHDELMHDLNVAYLHSVYQTGSALAFTSHQDSAGGYFGPNFTTSAFTVAGSPASPTPEPGFLAFGLCAAATGLLWRAQRLRRSPTSRA